MHAKSRWTWKARAWQFCRFRLLFSESNGPCLTVLLNFASFSAKETQGIVGRAWNPDNPSCRRIFVFVFLAKKLKKTDKMHQSYRSSRRSMTVLRRNGRGIRSPDNPCLTELTQVRQTCMFLVMIRIDWVYKDPPRRWNLPYSNRIQIGVKNELMYLGNKLLVNARSAPATKNPLEGVRVWGVVRGGFRLIPSFLDHRWGSNFQSRWGWGGAMRWHQFEFRDSQGKAAISW